uniref:Uncharacterized protein n=1 Tax=Anopheles atroparvus TaxID=41427 RepID=A0AAG5CSR6_ANOAO
MEASTDTKFDFNCSPKTESHYRRLSSLSINSGSTSKHMATSPMKHAAPPAAPSPKKSPQKLTPQKSPDHQQQQQQQRTLEKSNSLGDNKPPRLLRNTRSLSPRPPVRHQHSIMVSDENDIISVKLSPNEEFEDERGTGKAARPPEDVDVGQKPRSSKEGKSDTSPVVSEGGAGHGGAASLKLGECLKSANSSNNRSTSCLVYVPSDPWTRMSASSSPSPASKQHKSKTLDNSGKSYGRAASCLDYMKHTDPWVWRSNVNLPASGGGAGGKGTGRKRNALTHQTKSLTNTVNSRGDDGELGKHQPKLLCQQQSLGRIEKTLTIPGVDGSFDARKKITRPKLQRSKSPSFYEDFFQQPASGCDSNKSPSSAGTHSLAKKPVPSSKMEKNASNSTLNGHTNNGASGGSTSNSGSFSSYNGSGSPTARKQPSPKLSFLSTTPASQPVPPPPQSPLKKSLVANHHHPDPTKASLNLLNPNHLQPRHSFSTPSQKDDELQLNIRRLSEQMNKYSHSAGFPSPPAFLNDTILQQQHQPTGSSGMATVSKKVGGSGSSLGVVATASSIGGLGEVSQRKTASHSKINEPILETRC